MKQIATVTAMLSEHLAEVTVVRQSACAHDCGNCAGCGAQTGSITVRAKTAIELSPGDRVEIFSDNHVLGYAALVYLVPIILFLAGYILPSAAGEVIRFICGGAGFVLGIGACIVCDRMVRRKNAVAYQVVRKL